MKDSLGDRMKGIENVSRHKLIRRMPVIVRVDGRAFHTLTQGMVKPYDEGFTEAMRNVANDLCEEMQNAVLAFVQSDEVSVLMVDWRALDTEAWFDNNLQKIASVSASVATAAFNHSMWPLATIRRRGTFDARAFNIPREEVVNYFVWRQQDATRNSIQGLGQKHFSAKELTGVSCNQIQEKLHAERGINWNDVPTYHKRGACAVKETYQMVDGTERTRWIIDKNVPVFTADRSYVQKHLDVEPAGRGKM